MKTKNTETQAQHTPGPWQYDDVWSLIHGGPDSVEVAAIHSAIKAGQGRGADTAKREARETASANARLIAAAPELLAIVQSCLSLPTDSGGQALAECARLRQAARAAISKATGGI